MKLAARAYYLACLNIALILGGFLLSPGAVADELVHYPKPALANDPQVKYFLSLLQLALSHSKKNYELAPTSTKMLQAGVIRDMTSPNGQVDLFWSMTTDEREAQLLPVRIPLDKGLIGWRIALIKPDKAPLFHGVKTIKDLRGIKAGQEQSWPDTDILKSNGLEVVTASSEDAMFSMLIGGRFEYFPRSVLEIQAELQLHPAHGLIMEKEVILHYPSAFYFFVSPRRPDLAEDVRAGLEKAIADRSFERLFQQYMQPAIDAADIKHRRIIELKNPLLSSDRLPLHRADLWYQP
ncbi:substrate-binding periplasmic protein [Undibacterium terreum]|uniref:Solute-binding protein family 3/N-terminal domain-containing protein n=1 Tax=Undibacterium terreum TaxID=1224302 RepID=A0A916XAE1_9BURK|nr:transporter substrate-binding domain-containing protein [Undibacterium terreum]GGC58705.1 hypothetical protein GCM10011396_02000 [Undibacterium terreum]